MKSKRQLFGTDGIRGEANIYPMTCEIATALGRAVTHYFQSRSIRKKIGSPLIIIGKDTRLSCYMLEQAFSSGVCSQGGRVIFTGPLPTPGIAFVTKSMRANAGVMISASHNIFSDNGIKIFNCHGHKLPDEVELELEDMILNPTKIPAPLGENLGKATRLDEVIGRYIVHVKSAFNDEYKCEDLRIVLDCANGAGYKVGPMIFRELGAEVFPIGVSPNGTNINKEIGSLYPSKAEEAVINHRADIGICLDGDADRLVIIDENGKSLAGDILIGIFAKLLLDQGKLKKGDEVVGTVMSNLALEKYIKGLGLKFFRAQVGDRYILERMRDKNSKLGGEPSGHVIFHEHSSTGDGILAALKTIECMKHFKKPLSQLAETVKLYPQIIKNVPVKKKPPMENNEIIQKALKKAVKELGSKGRIVLRYSGTESLARVMIEGEDPILVTKLTDELSSAISLALT